jgi:hypothetical protein
MAVGAPVEDSRRDGPIDSRYQLKDAPTNRYPRRTEWNVRDSDGTVVFTISRDITGGSKKTVRLAALEDPDLQPLWRSASGQARHSS